MPFLAGESWALWVLFQKLGLKRKRHPIGQLGAVTIWKNAVQAKEFRVELNGPMLEGCMGGT